MSHDVNTQQYKTGAAGALLLATALGISGLAAGQAAAAQEAAEQQPAEGIEEIMVTAQKRRERLTDVPVAVTALSGYTVEQHLARNVESVQRLVPSLTFRKGTTTRNSALFLRGVGTISFSTAAEPSVSTVVDGVVYARSGQAFDNFLDLERVEVLRGPQGTLFGKNASVGVVNITTRRPGDEVEAEVLTSVFQGNEYRVRGIASGPITDDLKARLAAHYGQFDGYLRNVYTGEDVNGYQRRGARGTVVWTPTTRLDLTLIADYSQGDDDCCAEVIGSIPGNGSQGVGAAVLKTLGPRAKPNGASTHTINQDLVSTTRDDTYGVSLQADLSAGSHVLTSVSAYRGWENTEIRDGDFMANAASHMGMFQLHDLGEQSFTQLSQELRIASPQDQLISYQAGLFAFLVDSDRTFTRDDVVCLGSSLPVDESGLSPCTEGAATYAAPSSTANFGTRFENQAIFGQTTLNATGSRFVLPQPH
jgi:iron complex outermembrane receptor protein